MTVRTKFLTACMSLFLTLMFVSSAYAGKKSLENSVGVTIGEQCVRPAEFMRRNHMEVLKTKRDETLRQGIRTDEFSLKGCIDCHVNVESKKPIPVNAEGQFCSGCHEYAAVSIDCFQCHATVPAKNSERLKKYFEKQATGANQRMEIR